MRVRYPAIIGAVSALLVACGAQQQSTAGVSTPPSEPPLPASSAPPSLPTADNLAGTITTTGGGTTLKATWYVGQPLAADPSGQIPAGIPPDAVAACNADSTAAVATSVYVPARLEVTYATGSLATQVGINGTPMATRAAVVAYNADQQWTCPSAGTGAVNISLQPGETRTFDALIVEEVLSNTHPAYTSRDAQSLAFANTLVSLDQVSPLLHPSGPGAVCDPTDPQSQFLFAFRRGPQTLACATYFSTQ